MKERQNNYSARQNVPDREAEEKQTRTSTGLSTVFPIRGSSSKKLPQSSIKKIKTSHEKLSGRYGLDYIL